VSPANCSGPEVSKRNYSQEHAYTHPHSGTGNIRQAFKEGRPCDEITPRREKLAECLPNVLANPMPRQTSEKESEKASDFTADKLVGLGGLEPTDLPLFWVAWLGFTTTYKIAETLT